MFEDITALEKEVAKFRANIADTERFVELVDMLLQETKKLNEESCSNAASVKENIANLSQRVLAELNSQTDAFVTQVRTSREQMTQVEKAVESELEEASQKAANEIKLAVGAAKQGVEESTKQSCAAISSTTDTMAGKLADESDKAISAIRAATQQLQNDTAIIKGTLDTASTTVVQKMESTVNVLGQQQQAAVSQAEKVISTSVEVISKKIDATFEDAARKLAIETERAISDIRFASARQQESTERYQTVLSETTKTTVQKLEDATKMISGQVEEIKAATKAKITISTVMSTLAFLAAAAAVVLHFL